MAHFPFMALVKMFEKWLAHKAIVKTDASLALKARPEDILNAIR